MDSHLLGSSREVVGVDTDAVTADEARCEANEVPFRGCRVENSGCVDSQPIEYHRQLVHQRDIRSRCVFSITLAASATWMLGACVLVR